MNSGISNNDYNFLTLNHFLGKLQKENELSSDNYEKILELIENVTKNKEENDIKKIAFQEGYDSGYRFGYQGKLGDENKGNI